MKTNSLLKFSRTSSVFFLFIVLFACTQKKGISIKNATTKIKIEVKEEKHYYVKDRLDNLDFMDTMKINDYYKQNYEPLSDSLKIFYLTDNLKDETGHPFTKEMLTTDTKAFLIASLWVGSFFRPNIIKIYGKDYTALVLAHRYHEENFIYSGETLYNYKLKNPKISNDTLIVTQPRYKFEFKGWAIIYEKTFGTIVINPVTKKREYFIDKITYKTETNPSGAPYTNIMKKSRISKKFEIEDFQSY